MEEKEIKNKKSLKINAILSGIKTLLSIMFPLITFPYVSRILQVENLGKVDFGNSIVSYFSLIAALGISTYGIREGASLRNNKEKFNKFFSEIFSINMSLTIISYLLLGITILIFPKLHQYKVLIAIQSITIIFSTIGSNWVYSVFEDYFYITVRSLLFQIISLIIMVILVKNKEDYYIYALVVVLSNVGANILNFIRLSKYTKVRFTKNINITRHIKQILIIFSTNIATTIYINSGVTILGLISGSYSVGLYSVSVKVYSIIKQLVVGIIIVALPRLSVYFIEKSKELYSSTLTKILNSIVVLVFPMVTGIFMLSNEIIIIISGKNYVEANISLKILSVSLIFSTFSAFFMNCVFLPMKEEIYILKATLISAILNLILNILFIPIWKHNGVAVSTLITEFVCLIICFYHSKDLVKFKNYKQNIKSSFIGCIAIVILVLSLKCIIKNIILYVFLTIFTSLIIYYIVLLLLKNKLACEIFIVIRSKLKRYL